MPSSCSTSTGASAREGLGHSIGHAVASLTGPTAVTDPTARDALRLLRPARVTGAATAPAPSAASPFPIF
jgi:hypothetical protein